MTTPDAIDTALDGFRAWLEGKAPDAVVGHRALSCLCPVATYLRESDTLEDAQVLAGAVYDAADWERWTVGTLPPPITELPAGLSEFTVLVDNGEADDSEALEDEPITAYQSLLYLAAVGL